MPVLPPTPMNLVLLLATRSWLPSRAQRLCQRFGGLVSNCSSLPAPPLSLTHWPSWAPVAVALGLVSATLIILAMQGRAGRLA